MSQGRILFAGTPPIAARCLNTLVESGADVVGVLTRPDAPVGRKRLLTPSPVSAVAQEHGIPIVKASGVDSEISAQIRDLSPDLGIAVAYGALLPQTTLDIPTHGWVNLHYSDLPKYRGAAPVQHAMLNGDTTTAATVFALEAGMDTGPIHASVGYTIPELTSAGTVLTELTERGSALLIDLLPGLLSGSAKPTPQEGEPSFAPKLERKDAFIDTSEPAEALVHRINATIPEPGAWTLHGQSRVKFGVVRLYKGQADGEPGEVRVLPADRAPDTQMAVLTAGDGVGIVLTQIQPAGKQMMNATDWLRGQQNHAILGGTTDG